MNEYINVDFCRKWWPIWVVGFSIGWLMGNVFFKAIECNGKGGVLVVGVLKYRCVAEIGL